MPVALVPNGDASRRPPRVLRSPSRSRIADAVVHAARAALLGAALATRVGELFGEALDDRLHEPHRAATAPLLAAVRGELPPGALGATISGSGPTVIVWARDDAVDACVADWRTASRTSTSFHFRASPKGAHAL